MTPVKYIVKVTALANRLASNLVVKNFHLHACFQLTLVGRRKDLEKRVR